MEQVRCNICEVSIEVSAAKEHAMLQSHAEQKAKLEGKLLATKRGAEHDHHHDISVASQWAAATAAATTATTLQ